MSETVLDFDLVELRSRERELQSLAMRASTAEMGPAVFDGYLPLWYLEVISSHLDACLRYVRGLPNGLKRICAQAHHCG